MTIITSARPSILLVEDTLSQAQRFKARLEEGYPCDVQVVHSGEAGLEAARQQHYDLFVLDVELPGINGFELCRQLKEDDDLASIPVIMLTTRDRAEDALIGLSNGAVDYIPKDAFAEFVLLETLRQMSV